MYKGLQGSIYLCSSLLSYHPSPTPKYFSNPNSTTLVHPFTHHIPATPAFLLSLEYVIIPQTLPVSLYLLMSLSQKPFFKWLAHFTSPDAFLTTFYEIQLPSRSILLGNIFLHCTYCLLTLYYELVNFVVPQSMR